MNPQSTKKIKNATGRLYSVNFLVSLLLLYFPLHHFWYSNQLTIEY